MFNGYEVATSGSKTIVLYTVKFVCCENLMEPLI